jgi:exonuclease III
MFLFGEVNEDSVKNEPQQEIKILAWNLQSPSLDRARQQTDWLLNSGANIFLLTEATPSEGSYYLISKLESMGFKVFYSTPHDDKYFTAICVRGFPAQDLDLKIPLLPSRLQGVRLQTLLGEIQLVGIYAPTSWKNKPESHMQLRKEFHTQVLELLNAIKPGSSLIVGGDLNVLEPSHIPQVPGFEDPSFYTRMIDMGLVDSFRKFHPTEREYSWHSVDRIGCRFDHFFISEDLVKVVLDCKYDHEARFRKLSDHSAMWLTLGR